ncbi:MAG: endonuclease/exonuclease/phosphatase family protein [Candidatus Cryptobacteroides sp.]
MRKSKKKHGLFFGITSRTLMAISAGLLLLSYLSSYVNPAKAWFMTLFGLLYAPLLLLNAFLLVWAIFRRSRAFLIPLIAIAPSIFMIGKYFRPSSEAIAEDERDLRIITYNVGRFSLSQGDKFKTWKECRDSVMAYLKTKDADIICLQEFQGESIEAMTSYLAKTMKGYRLNYYVKEGAGCCFGNVTLSRTPVRDKGRISFDNSANLAFYTDHKVGDKVLRVYNCHFQSYGISLSRLAESMEVDYKKTVRETEDRMKNSIIRRPEQVEQVMESIDSCPVGTIVAGDFNDTPMSYTYYRLCRGRKDSFEEAGSGVGATFSRLRPFLRIDYVLFPDCYDAVSHKVEHKKYSDHYPVEAVIDLGE